MDRAGQRRIADLHGRYTTSEAAHRAGIHPVTLRIYIKQGIVPGAEKVRGRYWIRKEPFDAWVRNGERMEGAAA